VGDPGGGHFSVRLSDRSAGGTQKIVTALFDWLRDVGYLQLNGAAGLPTVGGRYAENSRASRRQPIRL
jgi:hypothetical protein